MELVIDALDEELKGREDLVLSARFGSVRKQVVVSKAVGQALSFPKLTVDEKEPLVVRFDLLTRSGSAFVVLRPGGERYEVCFAGSPVISNAGAPVLTVRAAIANGGKLPSLPSPLSLPAPNGTEAAAKSAATDGRGAGDGPARKAKKNAAKDAKEYLEQHDLPTFFHALLHTVIRERPSDPYEFIARQFPQTRKDAEERLPMANEIRRLRSKNEDLVSKVEELKQQIRRLKEGQAEYPGLSMSNPSSPTGALKLAIPGGKEPQRRPSVISNDDGSSSVTGADSRPGSRDQKRRPSNGSASVGSGTGKLGLPMTRAPERRPTVLEDLEEQEGEEQDEEEFPDAPPGVGHLSCIGEGADEMEQSMGDLGAASMNLAVASVEDAAAAATARYDEPLLAAAASSVSEAQVFAAAVAPFSEAAHAQPSAPSNADGSGGAGGGEVVVAPSGGEAASSAAGAPPQPAPGWPASPAASASHDRPASRASSGSPERSRGSTIVRRMRRGSEPPSARGRGDASISFSKLGALKAQPEIIEEGLNKFWARVRGDINEEDEFRVLRQSITTGRWTLYSAGGKAKKPSQYNHGARSIPRAPEHPTHEHKCPFCPGNESKTPDPLLAFDKDGNEIHTDSDWVEKWVVRVIPNIFPLLITPKGLYGEAFQKKLETIPHSSIAAGMHTNQYLSDAIKKTQARTQATDEASKALTDEASKALFRQIHARGYSEVVIENRIHNGLLAIVPHQQVALGLRAWQARGRVLAKQPGVRMLLYFKQYGALSGGSLVHPHMQVITLPLLTPEMHNRLERAWAHHEKLGNCAVCQAHIKEIQAGQDSTHSSRLIYGSKHFLVIAPFAASQYRVTIVPKKHHHSWLSIGQEELEDMAYVLQLVMESIYNALDDPEYNIYIFSCDKEEEVQNPEAIHWCMEIHPRFPAELGGLELASGIRVISGLPEDWARTLREEVEKIITKREAAGEAPITHHELPTRAS